MTQQWVLCVLLVFLPQSTAEIQTLLILKTNDPHIAILLPELIWP